MLDRSALGETCLLDMDFIAGHYDMHRGVRARIAIEDAVPNARLQNIRGDGPMCDQICWFGVFCSTDDYFLLARWSYTFFCLSPAK